MSQNNEQQQERSRGCENTSQNNGQQQERCQACKNTSQNNEQQQEMSQACEYTSQNNGQLRPNKQDGLASFWSVGTGGNGIKCQLCPAKARSTIRRKQGW